jgi:hypothetical protein
MKAEQLQNEHELDFIFFDLPGTMNAAGVVKTLACMDYIFAPISADRGYLFLPLHVCHHSELPTYRKFL